VIYFSLSGSVSAGQKGWHPFCQQRHIPIDGIGMAATRFLKQQTEKRAIPPKRNHDVTMGKRKIPISNSFSSIPGKQGGPFDKQMALQYESKQLEDINSWLKNREIRINAFMASSQDQNLSESA